jgi:hypothetical protein
MRKEIAAGVAALDRGDNATALRIFSYLAQEGNADAQFRLGWMYARGSGVPQDRSEALKWYQLSALQGCGDAQVALAVIYSIGSSVPQDYTEAAKWYRLAAQQGNAFAQNALGLLYANGDGVPQNYIEAAKWWKLAAQERDANAQFHLGVMYDKGRGVSQDDLPGSFCTKRIDRNWLGKELGHAEEETNAGADSNAIAADRSGDVTGKIGVDCVSRGRDIGPELLSVAQGVWRA